jgi:hypothetical protein
MSCEVNKMERFMTWLTKHGAITDALMVSTDVPGIRGVVATRDIAAYECCMSIPATLMISEASAREDTTLGPVFDAHRDLFARDDPLLATFMTYHIHLKEESFYFPYLSILPDPESIQNWTRDELSFLQDRYNCSHWSHSSVFLPLLMLYIYTYTYILLAIIILLLLLIII